MAEIADGRPDPVDVHVGSRIRLRRTLLAMTQERLGDALGVTFQQVQKYEKGANRVGASRLFDLSRILDVSISFFYDAMSPELLSSQPSSRPAMGFAEAQAGFDGEPADIMSRRETLDMVRAYYRITDLNVRKRMLDLIKSMAPSEDETR